MSTAALLEKDLQQAVIDTARLLGWRVAHFRAARTKHGWVTPVAADGKGFPDLVLVNEQTGRLIFAELKSDTGKLSPEQQAWLEGLRKLADGCDQIEVHVWTPCSWPAEITEALSGRQVVLIS